MVGLYLFAKFGSTPRLHNLFKLSKLPRRIFV
jgi:hypothetical protein